MRIGAAFPDFPSRIGKHNLQAHMYPQRMLGIDVMTQ
jgi:hypothetical protein